MKILHIGKYYPPFRGGMETALENICEGLLDAGHEVVVITAGETSREQIESIAGPESGREGRLVRVGVRGVVFSQPLTAGLLGVLRREVARLQPDVVHLHLPNPLAAAAWLALSCCRSSSSPTMAVWYHADITRQKIGRQLLKPLLSACLKRAAGITVAARALRDRSPILADYRSKVSVIPFGIAEEPWLSVEPRRDGPFLFVGRLVAYKGIDILLKALAEVPAAELVIVGEGPLKASLQALAGNLQLKDRVIFAGSLAQAQIAACMAEATALILPSVDESEAFGLVQLEAMASGVPVVATDLPTGVPEVGEDGLTGFLVAPNDSAALAKSLLALHGDPSLRRAMGEAGRARFLAHSSRRRMVERLTNWYEDVLS